MEKWRLNEIINVAIWGVFLIMGLSCEKVKVAISMSENEDGVRLTKEKMQNLK